MMRWLMCLCILSSTMARDPFADPVLERPVAPAVPSRINFGLAGVVIGEKSYACIVIKNQIFVVKKDEYIADGWYVHAITLDEVELKNKNGAIARIKVGQREEGVVS